VLALALLVPTAARAADETASEEADAGAAQVDRCTPPEGLSPDLTDAYDSACAFFGAVADRDLAAVLPHLRAPFYFEGTQVNATDDIVLRWKQLLADRGGGPSTFYGLEVLSYDEMVKKHGKPPAKLQSVPLRGAVIAVANFDGRAEVAALKREGGRWAVFAFHD